jgi:hypothetical protein
LRTALGFAALREDGVVPETHRLGVGEACVHRIRVLGAELAQLQASRRESWMQCGLLCHFAPHAVRNNQADAAGGCG